MQTIFLYFVIVVSFIDTMAQLPILAPFITSLGATSIMVGIIMGAYSFSNMIGNLGAGFIIDRYGRKIGIYSGMFIAGMAVFLYAYVTNPMELFILRIVHGVGGAILIPAAFAFLGDLSENDSVGKSMGYSGAAVGMAAMLGPMFAGIGKDVYGINVVFMAIGLALMITSILVYIFLEERFVDSHRLAKSYSKQDFILLIKNPYLRISYIAGFSLMYSMGVLAYAFPLLLEQLSYSSKHTGMLFSLFSIMAIIIFILPINRFSDRYGRVVPIGIGIFLITVSISLLQLGSSISFFSLLMIVYGCGFGLIFPAMTALVVDQTNVSTRGKAFGIFYAAFSLGVFLGPIMSGYAERYQWKVFWVAAFCLAILQIIFYFLAIRANKN
ncbi:hypothetical protein BHU72_08985 [Desulfuribacillus stibiiarsenatis]|uniref:Major facilitator superfamily (MFS) profile domain-containing protein n=1 Tax=Desulfuribacillus stibiiarsenatis TaxID=1390249 RepID=A0A1E5L3A5_9FIRM|nr:MFS transporter [Desulfuribacillus stibiiarsenatis]OEH84620.1 hypothetical protein BHU72_08985 [Desulfuribacillus stibiiarsenatis]